MKNTGASSRMRMDFAPRLNILTGDNGLGKTFAMDIAWWALTGTWAGLPALPGPDESVTPRIEFGLDEEHGGRGEYSARYDFQNQEWSPPDAAAPPGALVIYVRVDGRVSVFDPSRNLETNGRALPGGDDPSGIVEKRTSGKRVDAYHFTRKKILDGLYNGDQVLCNGLIRDWEIWRHQSPEIFRIFKGALERLSPHEDELIRTGESIRVSIKDARKIPTIAAPYGPVPITHVSAGMRRVLSLAYILIWAWSEHVEVSALMKKRPVDRLVLLFDEVEAHLHPMWQRVFLPSIFKVVKMLRDDLAVQIIAGAHAPLVLASVETEFREDKDRILNFKFEDRELSVREIHWAKQGDAVNWLVSDTFGLRQARSKEAEKAIRAAEAFMLGEIRELPDGLDTKDAIHKELQRVLPGHDQFWPRWMVETRESGA
ncbi:MAG: AAA family ATPase [Desulfobacterales bacterium]|nr:AAA family ATPase [Desulfobacterales bacterium]